MGTVENEDNSKDAPRPQSEIVRILLVSKAENDLEGISPHPAGDKLVRAMLMGTCSPDDTIAEAHRILGGAS